MPDDSTTPGLEETANRAVEALSRRDYHAFLAVCAPDAVWETTELGLGAFEGREAIGDFFRDWIGPYEDYHQDLVEFRDLGNGITFSVLHQRGRIAGSSGFAEIRSGVVTTWGNGLIKRFTTYTDIDEARAAAEHLAEERG